MWDSVKKQIRSVIQWEQVDPNVLFHLWSKNGDEIKNASKLLVKPGQGAIFVYEGKVEAVILSEGLYDLKTANIPFITTLSKFMQAFESQHKVGIYFFWQTKFLDQKWGTSSPVKYQDPIYNFPVSLKAYGNFSCRITEAKEFFIKIVGAREEFLFSDLRAVLVARLLQPLTDKLATAGLSYAEIDKNRNELSSSIKQELEAEFSKLGFMLTDFRIEGTEFDDETRERIGSIATIQAEAYGAKAAGIDYTQLQQLRALRDAASNANGAAGAGVAIGAGVGLGQVMAGKMMQADSQAQISQHGAVPENSVKARLQQLLELKEAGLISDQEYQGKREEILKTI